MNDPRTQIKVSVAQKNEAAEPDISIHQPDAQAAAEGSREQSPAGGPAPGIRPKPGAGSKPRQHLSVL
ncbi:hypothetical protein P4H66_23355, partial [Paenibacillus dokdonensis]